MSYTAPSLLMQLFGWAMPPPPIRIDVVELDDVAGIAAIHAASFAHDWSVDELAALVSEASVTCLVAKRANAFGTRRPIGFILLRIAADEAEVLTVAVDPARRGRGYGKALVMAGIERLIRRGIGKLFLEVDVGNASAVQLYRRLGFVQVGERKGYYKTGSTSSTALVMRLDL